MSDLLLQTKLFKPALRPSLINRKHLIDRLNSGLKVSTSTFATRLTLVSAPAGFGKTTLVSSWLAGLSAVKTAWLSLDENDNDPVRFLTYLVAALQTAEPSLGETAVRLLQSPQPPPAETILTMLINDVSHYGRPLILVLDDYHAITTPPIHQAMAFILENLPPSFHLLLTTRSDPPLPLSNLRARSQVIELRASELRFTIEEAGQFLNQVMGLEISVDVLTALEERTEGWIAGLQLAALSMQGRDDLTNFIAAFTGSNRFILDYLTDEVLERRPKGTRDFLLKTAVLDRVCGPLADAVTGQLGGQAVLEKLERANLFLSPLDDARQWYRYHHLFAEVLQQRLAIEEPTLVKELHTRASIWFEQNNLQTEAVNHAFLAKDNERVAGLIEQAGMTWLETGIVNTLRRWLDALPEETLKAHPQLNLTYAYALIYTGDQEGFKSRLEEIKRMLRGPNTLANVIKNDLLAEVAALQARAAFDRNLGQSIDELRSIFNTISEGNKRVQGIMALAIGHAERLAGNLAEAAHFFNLAANLAYERDDKVQAVYTLGFLADLQETQGFLRQAALTYQQSLQMAAASDGKLLPIAATACIGLGKLFYEWNDLEKAGQYLQQALEFGRQSGIEAVELHSALPLALVLEQQGSPDQANEMVQKAAEIANKWHLPPVTVRVSALEAQLWLLRGQPQNAANWASTIAISRDDDIVDSALPAYATLARLQIAQARPAEALLLLDRLLIMAEHAGLVRNVIEILGLKALAWQAKDHRTEAAAALERALTLGQPAGFCRVFLDEGQPMVSLLRQAHLDGRSPDFIEMLLAAFPTSEPKQFGADLLPEPLSEREREVLQLISIGMTNKEIAERLFIAVSTVKKHISNILVKLDTTNRVEAVARAGELGLLP